MKYLSLFSGIGGFELGIQQAYENNQNREDPQVFANRRDIRYKRDNSYVVGGIRRIFRSPDICVGYSEIDKYAVSIYQKHFPDHHNYGDITKINEKELPDFELLCGGFPCQSFSIAGKRGGFSDTRGTMFFEIARILKTKQPRLLLLENVKGLLSHDEGKTFATIISTLDELGYDLQWQVLNSKNFGVPQNRERVFIVGHLRGTSRPQVFPLGESSGNNPQQRVTLGTLTARYPASQREGAYPEEERDGQRKIRRLTPKECERLQGFPDGWTEGVSDTQRYKCLGNAVTVTVIEDVIKKILYPLDIDKG